MVFAIRRPASRPRQRPIDDPNKPPLAANFFTGSGAGRRDHRAAADLSGIFGHTEAAGHADRALYALIGFLMVSRLPVFSGKNGACGCRRKWCCRFRLGVFFVALLIGYPWHILSFGSVLYLMSLPLGWKNYRDHERSAAAQAAAATDTAAPPSPAPAAFAPAAPDAEQERPARLN